MTETETSHVLKLIVPQFLQPYTTLILQTLLTISLSLLLSFLRLPTLFLHGLFTYIHPDSLPQNSSTRAAIRSPSSNPNSVLPRKRSKDKSSSDFDENNAQIFRIKLDDAHLQSRLFFREYRTVFVLCFVTLSCLALQVYLGNGSFVPVVLGLVSVSKLNLALCRVSFERSASRKREKESSLIFGGLGFLVGLAVCSSVFQKSLDFELGGIDGFGSFLIACFMGCVCGFLYMPAGKIARAFWLGTDQIRCNLSIISCGWFARLALYAMCLVNIFTALLWFNPLTEILVNKNLVDGRGRSLKAKPGEVEGLSGNVGVSRSVFVKVRLWCLLLSGLTQIVTLRWNLQMYLNEAVLSWYQRLHASRVPELDYSRAKVFLHDHYICLAVLQFLSPAALVLIFLGFSQIDGSSLGKFNLLCNQGACSEVFQRVALLLAWWVVFVWAVFTSVTLVLYRRGFLHVS